MPQREGVVVIVQRAGRFLVIRRAAGVPAPNAWCFVGGGIEPGERQEDAIVREFREEVGGSVTPIEKVWEWTSPDAALRLHWWTARLDSCTLTPNPLEAAELAWCSCEEIELLPGLLESNSIFLREMRRKLSLGSASGKFL